VVEGPLQVDDQLNLYHTNPRLPRRTARIAVIALT
jgi:hypothetical protein